MVPETTPLLRPRLADIPPAPWCKALRSQRDSSRRIPQAIAHRGYKAAFPENTMAAFGAAVKVGAHAIETDLHLSRDGIVVLSHDGTLKRCFGVDKKINECDWAYISTLRTLREPPEPMPTLAGLLEYLALPEHERLWLLLDIKMDDPAPELMSKVAEVIKAAPASGSIPWNLRIVLGCWNQVYITHSRTYLPTFPLAHIGISVSYARKFLPQPNVAFNMLQKVLVGPVGRKFRHDVRAADRPLFVWTVNDEEWMRWSVREQVDGVITDDPKLFLDLCRRAEEEGMDVVRRAGTRRTALLYAEAMWLQLMVTVCMPFILLTGYGRWGMKDTTQKAVHG